MQNKGTTGGAKEPSGTKVHYNPGDVSNVRAAFASMKNESSREVSAEEDARMMDTVWANKYRKFPKW